MGKRKVSGPWGSECVRTDPTASPPPDEAGGGVGEVVDGDHRQRHQGVELQVAHQAAGKQNTNGVAPVREQGLGEIDVVLGAPFFAESFKNRREAHDFVIQTHGSKNQPKNRWSMGSGFRTTAPRAGNSW